MLRLCQPLQKHRPKLMLGRQASQDKTSDTQISDFRLTKRMNQQWSASP